MWKSGDASWAARDRQSCANAFLPEGAFFGEKPRKAQRFEA
jgi:hypothetical protein